MTRERDALLRIVEEIDLLDRLMPQAFEDFDASIEKTRVAFYGLLVIGEAVGRIDAMTLARESAIPWPSVRASERCAIASPTTTTKSTRGCSGRSSNGTCRSCAVLSSACWQKAEGGRSR